MRSFGFSDIGGAAFREGSSWKSGARESRGVDPAILKVSRLPGQPAGRKDLPNISKESLGFAG
jgi:hypothetical protein